MKEIWRGCEAQLHLQRLTSALVVPSLKTRGVKRIQVMNIRKSLRDLGDCLPTLTSINLSGCSGISDTVLAKSLTQVCNMFRLILNLRDRL